MMLAAALAALAVAASSTSLDEARAAFAAADYARAEQLALQAAVPPDPRAALYLAGLSRFRLGRPGEALAAIDQAGDGADAPAAWHFNRGACLYALGRLPEAEREFLAAAQDPSFATLALVQAGFAALDAGATERARALSARARGAAAGKLGELVDELDTALGAPPAGPAASREGAGPAVPARWEAAASADLGWDDDSLQSGLGVPERGAGAGRVASALALATGWGALRLPAGAATAELGYAFSQLAYRAAAAQDRSVQQHEVTLALRGAPRAGLHVEAALAGGLALTGLDRFRRLQDWAGLQGSASLEHGALATTHLETGWSWKLGRSEFGYLGGHRLEAGLWEELHRVGARLRAGYRFRLERVGELETSLGVVRGMGACHDGCTATEARPLGYQGHLLWLAGRWSPLDWLRLDAGLGGEWRRDLRDRSLLLRPLDGAPPLARDGRGSEWRWSSSATAAVRLSARLSLELHHEWTGGRPQLSGGAGAPLPGWYRPASWDKQVVLLGGSLTF